jgi:hypothetical protein
MTIDDYEQMIDLWNSIEGLALSNANSVNGRAIHFGQVSAKKKLYNLE